MRNLLVGTLSVSSLFLMGAGHKHKAHEHGSAKLDIAIESKESTSAELQFESPAEAIYGFEHDAKTAEDKAKIEAANTKLSTDFSKMVVFDPSLGCAATVEKIGHDAKESKHHEKSAKKGKKSGHHGEHSDVEVEVKVVCQKPIAGTTINFAFDSVFPGLKKVKVQAVSAGAQSGTTIKAGGGSLKL